MQSIIENTIERKGPRSILYKPLGTVLGIRISSFLDHQFAVPISTELRLFSHLCRHENQTARRKCAPRRRRQSLKLSRKYITEVVCRKLGGHIRGACWDVREIEPSRNNNVAIRTDTPHRSEAMAKDNDLWIVQQRERIAISISYDQKAIGP